MTTMLDRTELAGEIAGRRKRLSGLMREEGLDGIVIATEGNTIYFTGYMTMFWAQKSKPIFTVLRPDEKPVIVCHAGESVNAASDAIDVDVRPYTGPEPAAWGQLDYHLVGSAALVSTLGELGVGRAGFELGWHFLPVLTPAGLERIRESVEVVDTSPLLWKLRLYKTPFEVEALRTAAQVNADAFELFERRAKPGMTERELTSALIASTGEAGADKITYLFAGIAGRGAQGGPTDRRWERGELIGADLCQQVNGYFADYCRTYASGPLTAEQDAAYADLVAGLAAGRSKVRAGVPLNELFTALNGGADALYGRVGHGLGIEMPEPPSIAANEAATAEENMVLCIEPNRAGGGESLVAEETVLVKADGYELLTPEYPAEPLVLG
jgi:Xaa-Pro aminopeptidase